jgi:hypothetical protein
MFEELVKKPSCLANEIFYREGEIETNENNNVAKR